MRYIPVHYTKYSLTTCTQVDISHIVIDMTFYNLGCRYHYTEYTKIVDIRLNYAIQNSIE